jgi:hypothetical protein
MSVLIQGPKQPGNDIDVYLRPLVDELLLLWKKEGVRVWDENKQENFSGVRVLPEKVRLALVKLCTFLNVISQKEIDPRNLVKLQNDVVQCLVSSELAFPPSFFDIMTHLLVHLVKEIIILGLVYLHNMWPFERFMSVLKKYVLNRARSEGSIAKGYVTEEVIEFCVDFVDSIDSIGVPVKDGNGHEISTYPRIPNPMGADAGLICACGHGRGYYPKPNGYLLTDSKIYYPHPQIC